ncbi:histidine kinase N-terminal 7TM domain-containing protein [Natronococcus sp. A-GB7]|uniref:sensor histidine kinase n=1 Tax=Natronococcus sp. A-GB7 TaxID=3037649 RepID=UPI00241C0DB7|nr:histidine kinase N-terminal 7TM domain-containing protein [Natronococcus sp. A-GB7]MDG5820679.1 histidine kinase N-terminal 7TM domain-containing protein [Natronococcus sp. A-GB7]
MAWQHTVYAYPILFATALSVVLGTYAVARVRRRGRSPTLLAFAAMTGAIAIWTGFSALKLLSTDPTVQFRSYQLLHVGSAAVGPLLLLFALAYTDRSRWLTPSLSVGVFVVPVAFVALLFTNPYDVAIIETRIVDADGLVVWRADRGPAHVALSFVYAALMATLTLAVVLYESVRTGRTYYPQAALLTVAVVAPVGASFLTVAGVPPFGREGVNLVPAAAGLSVVAVGIATFRYRLLDLPPIAYTTAMRNSPDGILVLDSNGRIVHSNESVGRLLGVSPPLTGAPVDAVLPELDEAADGRTIEVTTSEGDRFLELRSQPLRSQEATLGRVVVLRDVTAQKRYERSLELRNEQGELLNKLVRHDIRNEMGLVLGLLRRVDPELERLREDNPEVHDRLSEYTDRIRWNCEHVVDLTETVGDLLRTIDRRERKPQPTELAPILEAELEAVATAFEDARVEMASDLPDATVYADEMLSSVFYNLLTNAVVHSDDPRPEVTVTVTESDERILVAIADNGPGLPEGPRDLLTGETPLSEYDGSGYGLYIVRSLIEGYGAELSVAENRPTGSVVTVRLARAGGDREPDTVRTVAVNDFGSPSEEGTTTESDRASKTATSQRCQDR